jgi:hypothetical protein
MKRAKKGIIWPQMNADNKTKTALLLISVHLRLSAAKIGFWF